MKQRPTKAAAGGMAGANDAVRGRRRRTFYRATDDAEAARAASFRFSFVILPVAFRPFLLAAGFHIILGGRRSAILHG
ncbi:MAG: hypothetical protein DCC68_19515 [Planctomycetota bacterium]|nr:MAG: hypothetical protein DCC68_19515 [Planctomycetota bacterium]